MPFVRGRRRLEWLTFAIIFFVGQAKAHNKHHKTIDIYVIKNFPLLYFNVTPEIESPGVGVLHPENQLSSLHSVSYHSYTTMSTPQSFLDNLEEWEHSPTKCASPECPIKFEHKMGRYLHCGKRNQREPAFGSCNPPPEVWAALDRKRAGKGEATDDQLIDGFRKAHVFQGHGFLRQGRASQRQWRYQADKSMP